MASNRNRRSPRNFGINLMTPKHSPLSSRTSLKISAILSPKSSTATNRKGEAKKRRFLDDTDAEFEGIRQLRESTEEYIHGIKEYRKRLDVLRNVLWCKV